MLASWQEKYMALRVFAVLGTIAWFLRLGKLMFLNNGDKELEDSGCAKKLKIILLQIGCLKLYVSFKRQHTGLTSLV